MRSSRFLKILQSYDQASITKFRQSKQVLNNNALCARMFDEFPSLLPKEIIDDLFFEFVNIINGTQSDFFHFIICIRDYNLKSNLCKWLEKIIQFGKEDLLNQRLNIRNDIQSFLGWTQPLTLQQVRNVMLAYTSAVVQEVISHPNFKREIQEVSSEVLVTLVNHLNEIYDRLIKEAITPQEFRYTPFYGTPISGVLHFQSRPPKNEDTIEKRCTCLPF